ncbi:hypothetical protein DL89DRAFT_267842 [Linderina pennispora]|uniref:Uncharacterized protein n=1 Tax=Linderina pennispora TaxID=61395 RepID=A0A1Y1W8J3_9FUNG|nr:uncharacterized protein DL89DRAFT_267842 [Linderina pennispora]ORX69658.1 hypothetical protein DL89DRAFT_267842 [Linderina pennispora]
MPFEPLSQHDPETRPEAIARSAADPNTEQKDGLTQQLGSAESLLDHSRAYMQLAESRISTADVPTATKSTRARRGDPIGRSMPSSLMRRLNMKFHADIRQRRRRHGLRIRILGALSELQHLIQVKPVDKRDTRVFMYLSDLNRHYTEYLCEHAEPLNLRSSTCIAMERHRSSGMSPITIAVADAAHPQLIPQTTPYMSDNPHCPLFDREMYARRHASQGMSDRISGVQPDIASWIDYMVGDLGEPAAHALFAVVSQSKVPERTSSRLRAAVEEALVLAFNRRGFTLTALESLRVCEYYLRQQAQPVQPKQVLRVWQAAGEDIAVDVASAQDADLVASPTSPGISAASIIAELAFKRWNNVASMMIVRLCGWPCDSNVAAAWALVRGWFLLWGPIMKVLCPVPRHSFASGSDPHAWAYWRPKLPGRDRLHALTLSTEAIVRLMSLLVDRGHTLHTAQVLGFAISEIGVPATMSMFNVMLRGYLNPGRKHRDNLADLSSLPLLNTQCVSLYVDGARLAGQKSDSSVFMMLLRGMQRWSLTPDAHTLGVLILSACQDGDHAKLEGVLRLFATQWGIVPRESSWRDMEPYNVSHIAYKVLAELAEGPKPPDT